MVSESIVFYCFLAGLAGLLIGSFLNVCIYRLPRDLSVVRPRSFCTECGAQIAWRDNIPLVSYLLLNGRCRHCGERISLRYPLVEAITAALFVLVVAFYGVSPASLKWCVFETLLVGLFVTDLEERILPDELTIGGAIAGLVLLFFVHLHGVFSDLFLAGTKMLTRSLFEGVLAAVVLTGPIWLLGVIWGRLRKREVLGMGDVKLLPMLGLFLGLEQGILALLIGSLGGVVLGGGYIFLTRRQASSYELPLGSFFCAGAALIPFITQL